MGRKFYEVKDEFKKYGAEVSAHGVKQKIYPETILPYRADPGSAGYDFATPVEVKVPPRGSVVFWTNVKAQMEADEVLQIFVRSSIGINDGVTLANGTGIIDASYFENASNDGNIGICLTNNTGHSKIYPAGTRLAQGIFLKYLSTEDDKPKATRRKGGTGSSGKTVEEGE